MMQQGSYTLWKPIGDYKGSEKEEIQEKADQYFRNLLEGYEQWGSLLEDYEAEINRMLVEGDSTTEIVRLVREENFQTCCRVEYQFRCFSVACQIGQIEEENGSISNLSVCTSMEEVCNHMQALIFGLRRIEFGWEESELQIFLRQLEEWKITYVFLGEILCQQAIKDQAGTAERLARLLEKQEKHREVILLLFYVAKRLEYDFGVVMAFANTLLELGDIYWGNEMLQKIENPEPEIVELQKMLAERLQG